MQLRNNKTYCSPAPDSKVLEDRNHALRILSVPQGPAVGCMVGGQWGDLEPGSEGS